MQIGSDETPRVGLSKFTHSHALPLLHEPLSGMHELLNPASLQRGATDWQYSVALLHVRPPEPHAKANPALPLRELQPVGPARASRAALINVTDEYRGLIARISAC
jgi:hypothetical protein